MHAGGIMGEILHTLGENIHRVVDLNVHMIADGSKFIFLGANDSAVLALDFPRAIALFGEFTSDHNGLSVFLGLVRLLPLVLQRNGDFGCSTKQVIEATTG